MWHGTKKRRDMARFEEVRPLEGMQMPLQVRAELRQSFERWLPRPRRQHLAVGSSEMIDVQDILNLSQHYQLEYPGGAKDIAETWDQSEERIADGGPTFDDLVRSGWVFFDGGRWIMPRAPMGTLSYIAYPSPSTEAFLTKLSRLQLVAKTVAPPPEVQALLARIQDEDWLDRKIPSTAPDWLAGRLWERLCPVSRHVIESNDNTLQSENLDEEEVSDSTLLLEANTDAADKAFLEWSAWCNVLGTYGAWNIGWSDAEMRCCREAAHRAMERQTLWGNWNNDVARHADVLVKTFAIPKNQLRYGGARRKPAPLTLIFRADWLNWPEIESLMMERFGKSTVSFAFGLLCSELENTDIGPNIIAKASKVITFAVDHPMALQHLLFRVDTIPALLVDMLMHERAACLATKLVIEWRSGLARNSDRDVSREAQIKAFAGQDALSFLAYHFATSSIDLAEFASLVTWCYDSNSGNVRPIADSRIAVGKQLLEMVAREKNDIQSTVLKQLIDQAAYENNIPRVRFTGVLSALNSLSNVSGIDTLPVVALYSKFARDQNLDRTDAFNLPEELAMRLIATAFKQVESARDALLVPFDSIKLLRDTSDEEKSSLRSSIARTLRGHVRLLARAVAGWPAGEVPLELCNVLQKLISQNVIEHIEKERIGSLTDRHSPYTFLGREEGTPAKDLVAAWRRLDDSNRGRMLHALALSDDPVLLAQLCQNLPAAAKPLIQARLKQLKPDEASRFWTWTELQNRIESLLGAGEPELAREHLNEVEQNLARAPSQIRLAFFNLELRLLLHEKKWSELDAVVVPSALEEFAKRQAQEQLDFYRATSQLLRPNGKLKDAQLVLQRLAARPGAASAYKENSFAVAIRQLLGPTLQPLTGESKAIGERLLAEMNAVIAVNGKLVYSNLLANRALLMLALDRPEDALESVASRRKENRSSDIEIIVVLAKSKMGFRDEAMAILDAAIKEFDTDDRLIALKNDLQAGEDTPSIASASTVVDPISSIRAALQQLTELLPSQVGNVLGPPNGGLRGYLIRQVSRALAALQHMAAMLRDRKNPEEDAKLEDDLNTAVREVLGASLAAVKWDVADQSLGGATENGNPGERDAVIRASGQEISIYEALVCSGLERVNIKKHFDKLLSYGSCDTYFHVIYSYAKEVKPLLEYVQHMLKHEAPADFSYLNCEVLGPPNYETNGYIATYSFDHREVAVVFLIADLKVQRPTLYKAVNDSTCDEKEQL